MDGRRDGQPDRQTDGLMERRIDVKWMDRQMNKGNGLMDGQTYVQTDLLTDGQWGWADRWTDGLVR